METSKRGAAVGKRNDELKRELPTSPYSRFASSNLILRDQLAIDRTLLANERTLLAYLRSAIALMIAGVSIIHFVTQGWFWGVGLGCLPFGVLVGAIGVVRYRRMSASIGLLRRELGASAEPPAGEA